MGILNVDETISDLEFRTAKLAFLKEKYPNLKLKSNKDGFWTYSSKTVSREFNKFLFIGTIYGYYAHVRFEAFDEIDFEHKGTEEQLVISSIPNSCQFISLVAERYEDENGQYIAAEKRDYHIRFSKLAFKNKNKEIQEQIEEQAILTALDFVKKHPFAKVDPAGTSPRLEKLLTFS